MNTQNPATIVLDPVTLAAALTGLSHIANTGQPWLSDSDAGQTFMDWYYVNWRAVEALRDLKVKTAHKAAPLNQFLTDNGFEPMFEEIQRGGVGACAILDMLVKWAVEATLTDLMVRVPGSRGFAAYSAFELPLVGIEVFKLDFTDQRLVKINTADGGAFWLVMTDPPEHPLDMIATATAVMKNRRPADTEWISGVVVPTIEIDTQADISFMLGAYSGDHVIAQAFQLIKMRINNEGARVKAATGLATERCIVTPREPKPIIFDRPFTAWFTQAGSEVPMAVFYSAQDSWKPPAGRLEDL